MKDKIPQRELPEATTEQIDIASQLVHDGLGGEYDTEYGCLPRNVGTLGDEGVRGDTTMITTESITSTKDFVGAYESLGSIATEMCNKTPTTKVLIDITPTDAIPTLLNEQPKVNDVPFVDQVKKRVEGYPLLRRRFLDQLDGDPMLQTAVWAIIDVIDSRFKAKMARMFAKEDYGL